jgi:hypothetical protein
MYPQHTVMDRIPNSLSCIPTTSHVSHQHVMFPQRSVMCSQQPVMYGQHPILYPRQPVMFAQRIITTCHASSATGHPINLSCFSHQPGLNPRRSVTYCLNLSSLSVCIPNDLSWIPTTYRFSLTTCHVFPSNCHLFPATCLLPPAACLVSQASCHAFPVTCHVFFQGVTFHQQPFMYS